MDDSITPQGIETNVSDNSKFRAILVVARRAKQIQAGARPLIHTVATKSICIAGEEFRESLLPIEILLKISLP